MFLFVWFKPFLSSHTPSQLLTIIEKKSGRHSRVASIKIEGGAGNYFLFFIFRRCESVDIVNWLQ